MNIHPHFITSIIPIPYTNMYKQTKHSEISSHDLQQSMIAYLFIYNIEISSFLLLDFLWPDHTYLCLFSLCSYFWRKFPISKPKKPLSSFATSLMFTFKETNYLNCVLVLFQVLSHWSLWSFSFSLQESISFGLLLHTEDFLCKIPYNLHT